MSRSGERRPGNMEPAGAGQELVGVFTSAEEVDQALELVRVLGSDVGGLSQQVLGVLDATYQSVDARVAEAGVDDDGTNHLAGGFQQHQATIGHVHHVLHGGVVVWVFLKVEEFAQRKMGR